MREKIGTTELVLDLPAGATAADGLQAATERFPQIAPLFRASMLMRNHEYVAPDEELADGDELAFIPPVSGGQDDFVRVGPEVLDAAALTAMVEDDGAGAVVTFIGTVRDNARGRGVLYLDYEAYEAAAETQLRHVIAEMRERWPVLKVAIQHRVGKLAIGEASIVIAVSSAHRDAAYEASAYSISRIKEIVPIWKREAYDDGEVWIGSEADYQVEIGRAPTN